MKTKIALIGFGTVGQGMCEILLSKEDYLKSKYGFEASIVAISDVMKGAVYCADGLDIQQCLDLVQDGKSVEEYNQVMSTSMALLYALGIDIIKQVSAQAGRQSAIDLGCGPGLPKLRKGGSWSTLA